MKRFVPFCVIFLLMPLVVFAIPQQEPAEKSMRQVEIETEMVEVARRGHEVAYALYLGGNRDLEPLVRFLSLLLEAEVQQATTVAEKLAAIDAGIERASKTERSIRKITSLGLRATADHSAIKYHLLEMRRLRELVNNPR